MSKQCLYIEQAKHLQELGVEKDNSDVFWFKYVGDEYVKLKNICKCGEFLVKTKDEKSITQKVEGCEFIPTFTLQDILDILPKCIEDKYGYEYGIEIFYVSDCKKWEIGYSLYDDPEESIDDDIIIRQDNIIDAAYEMLCWLIENGYIETNKKE